MNVFVTGGAGYIGSILVPRLLRDGHTVTVLDNFMYGQTPLLDHCLSQNLKIVRGDARNKDLVERLLKEQDVIMPLACLTGAPLCARDPWAAREVILDAVQLILDLRRPEQRMIYPTTNSGYGVGEKGKFCDETTPLRPVSLYGRLKVEAETALLASGNAITLRLATAFGMSPRMRLDLLVNDFTYRAVYDRAVILFEASFNRNFIHVRDIAEAFVFAMDNFEAMKDQAYNVGLSDANLNKQELCDRIKKYVPEFYYIESEIGQDPDKRDYLVSNEKIEAAGYRPGVSLDEGIQELVKGYTILKRNAYANV
ncbi:MAG: NAD-dependent epimerase/dehydratase family protein [Candidatus Omnitrophota bacterium]